MAGAPGRAQALVNEAMPGLQSPRDRVHGAALQGELLIFLGRPQRATATLLEAARTLWPLDAVRARGILLDVLNTAMHAGRFASGADLLDVAHAALAMPLPVGYASGCGDLLLEGLAEWIAGDHNRAAGLLRDAIRLLRTDREASSDPRCLKFGCWAAFTLGDLANVTVLARRMETLARERGAWVDVQTALHYRAHGDVVAGSFAEARFRGAESQQLASKWVHSNPRHPRVELYSAWSADAGELRAQLALIRGEAAAGGLGYTVMFAEYQMAIVELSVGNYQAALAVWPTDWERNVHMATFASADFVEAASRGGDSAAAAAATERYERRARAAETPFALGLLARAQALVELSGDAESNYRHSVDLLETAGASAEVARSRLVYGEWLRRTNRRRDARDQLRAAHDTFDAIGAPNFKQRAHIELLASGERARKRAPEFVAELTPQEIQVSRLAAEGATNSEIASRLFISPSTVDYHLRKVYRKLDIPSRRHLARALNSH